MRPASALLCFALLSAAAAVGEEPRPARLEPFPLPSFAGKAPPVSPGQSRFRVPLRFARVEAFYRGRFGGDAGVGLALVRGDAGRTLTITSRRPGDAWLKAVVREAEVDTAIEVTAGVRLQELPVEGHGRPQVQLVIPVSDEVVKMANSIDHLTRDR
jgi:hypothetical protein